MVLLTTFSFAMIAMKKGTNTAYSLTDFSPFSLLSSILRISRCPLVLLQIQLKKGPRYTPVLFLFS